MRRISPFLFPLKLSQGHKYIDDTLKKTILESWNLENTFQAGQLENSTWIYMNEIKETFSVINNNNNLENRNVEYLIIQEE